MQCFGNCFSNLNVSVGEIILVRYLGRVDKQIKNLPCWTYSLCLFLMLFYFAFLEDLVDQNLITHPRGWNGIDYHYFIK